MVDDADSIAELLRLVHRVGGEHDGGTAVAQLPDERPRRGTRPRIHARGRLVEEHQARAPDQRQREREALLLAARHPAHERVLRFAEADEVEQPVGVVGVVVVGGEELQCLERADARVEPAVLEHHADLRAELRAVAPRVDAEHAHFACVGAPVALEDLDRGGLARAVRPEETEDLTGVDGERESVDGLGRAVALLERGDVDRVRRVHRGRSLAKAADRPLRASGSVDVRCRTSDLIAELGEEARVVAYGFAAVRTRPSSASDHGTRPGLVRRSKLRGPALARPAPVVHEPQPALVLTLRHVLGASVVERVEHRRRPRCGGGCRIPTRAGSGRRNARVSRFDSRQKGSSSFHSWPGWNESGAASIAPSGDSRASR